MDNTLTQAPATDKEVVRAELIRRFSDRSFLTSLIQKAVRDAVLEHKRAENPIAGSVDGKVVIFQPEDISVPEE
jgi:hypothetical protein